MSAIEPTEWSPQDEALAFSLAKGATRAEASAEVGISVRTCYTRLHDPAFRSLVDELRTRMLSEAIGKMASAAAAAAATLAELLGDGQRAEVRLGAAKAILTSLINVQAHVELCERVAQLEALSDGRKLVEAS